MSKSGQINKLNFDPSMDEAQYLKSIEKMKLEFKEARDELMAEVQKHRKIQMEFDEKNLTAKTQVRHKAFDQVAVIVRNRLNAFLYGPAGSGKSFIAEQVADLLKIPFYAISVSYQTSVATLMGYMDATGKYVPSLLREAFEKGGVFCIDEIDAGNQNVIMCLNAVTNSDVVAFPDKMVKKHKNFVTIATANTCGSGSDLQYVGRERIDASTLSRFVRLEIDYDDELEESLIAGSEYKDEILKVIRNLRRSTDLDSNELFTPRQTVFFAKLAEDLGFEGAKKIICATASQHRESDGDWTTQ